MGITVLCSTGTAGLIACRKQARGYDLWPLCFHKTETCHLEFCSSLGLPRPSLWSLARPYFNCTLAQYLQWWEWIEEKLQNISSSVNGDSIPIFELQFYDINQCIRHITHLGSMEPWNLKCEAWNLGSMVPCFHFSKNRVEPWNHGTQMCIMSKELM